MFENILTKESVSFKDLEQICFKIACEFAKELLKSMLKEYDNQLVIITVIKRQKTEEMDIQKKH